MHNNVEICQCLLTNNNLLCAGKVLYSLSHAFSEFVFEITQYLFAYKWLDFI